MGTKAKIQGPLGKSTDHMFKVLLTPERLAQMGQCLVDSFIKEAKKDFAKRGWSGEAKDGSAPIWDSFDYVVDGQTVTITSTYPHMEQLVGEDTLPRKRVWLTQEGKNMSPSKYPRTRREHDMGMKRGGSAGVPIKKAGGTVIFRTAPLTFDDAWIHPGIARSTFVQRAAKKGREECVKIIQEAVRDALIQGMSG